MDELPAGAAGFAMAPVAGDAMADGVEAGELLDADVDQLARVVALIVCLSNDSLRHATHAE
jgi:hypothetical protein